MEQNNLIVGIDASNIDFKRVILATLFLVATFLEQKKK